MASSAQAYAVAFQGEKGAYSEQAVFELLGRSGVCPIGFQSFDDAFDAINAGKVQLLMVPIENSLGGTIHANCDLQLQHHLFIIAEHNLRVRHCLLALPGTGKAGIKKIISHPQALAQCNSYINQLGVRGEAAYDTAGSAKLISEEKREGVAAICSELAADYYGLEILDRGIEDDPNNYTRFLLLRNNPVSIPHGIPCKTSIVFSLEDVAGSLFKALSVFALRDVDLSKIESRPCKPDIMDRLQRLYMSMGGMTSAKRRRWTAPEATEQTRFRYLFYLDFLAHIDEPNVANAIQHLQEITTFFRVLGSFPRGGALVGLENLGPGPSLPLPAAKRKRRLGILGFGTFGQFMAKKLALDFEVFVTNRGNQSEMAAKCGVSWCESIDLLLDQNPEILIIATSVLSFETVVRNLSRCLSQRSGADVASSRMLVVDVLSVKVHAKTTLLSLLPESCDVLCTHPMFGPESGKHSWAGLPFVFERVRLNDARRCEEFLKWWDAQGCRMVDMTCELHDETAAGSQFVTHLTGRVLARLGLRTTPINTKGFESLLQLVDNTCKDSFDLFFALYKCNPNSEKQLQAIEESIKDVSQELRSSMGKTNSHLTGGTASSA
eukprot:TRINITY_DN87372_c0_g1_i1.p1 TRINITY_DN87372_c0_g1~~TRINITY_DN87372_c0_g1_i1.p1  ORF type:complete len:607 (-),score=108.31 TRINITY_DN87372_c0_g1_i1:144-1964(-)